jgi:hypothetical protein
MSQFQAVVQAQMTTGFVSQLMIPQTGNRIDVGVFSADSSTRSWGEDSAHNPICLDDVEMKL